MQKINFSLLQPHTVKLYNLECKEYEVQDVPARSLLVGSRFDLLQNFTTFVIVKQIM